MKDSTVIHARSFSNAGIDPMCGVPIMPGHRVRTDREFVAGLVNCPACREGLRKSHVEPYCDNPAPAPAGIPPTTDALLAAADEMARTFRLVCAWNTPDCGGDCCHDTKPDPLFVAALARYRELRGLK